MPLTDAMRGQSYFIKRRHALDKLELLFFLNRVLVPLAFLTGDDQSDSNGVSTKFVEMNGIKLVAEHSSLGLHEFFY